MGYHKNNLSEAIFGQNTQVPYILLEAVFVFSLDKNVRNNNILAEHHRCYISLQIHFFIYLEFKGQVAPGIVFHSIYMSS